jgi:DNA helicase-2/ATP-dependent DNA helicase PcrA
VRTARGSADAANDLVVLDDVQSANYLQTAGNNWIDAHPELWNAFLPDRSPSMAARWREITERTARVYIQTAKNERYRPEVIQQRLIEPAAQPDDAYMLLWVLNGIYARYQGILDRQGALDFDDLIWQAADLMVSRPDLAAAFRQRWPYVLEDEAQDSVPLQSDLLSELTAGPAGNWVRVGDPNQAITSSFTAAHPRFFNAFIDEPQVAFFPLPNSGRSAPLIYAAANRLVNWVCDRHPVPEVRSNAFRRQEILPTPTGDAQPNPPDEEAGLRIRVYTQREEEELPEIARLAHLYAEKYTERTVAILTPTNRVGYDLSEQLDTREAPYDNLLRGGGREREIASVLHGLMGLLADPLDTRQLAQAHRALFELGHPVAGMTPAGDGAGGQLADDSFVDTETGAGGWELSRFHALLRSIPRPEILLFPDEQESLAAALPGEVATETDIRRLHTFLPFVRRLFALRPLPIDDLVLALADELFAASMWTGEGPATEPSRAPMREADLSTAHRIAAVLRRWHDLHPEWRLPEMAAALAEVAAGRRTLPLISPTEMGYEPQPGRITLTTQHGAKGLEWDAVFLVGIDNFWIPGDLDAPFLGSYDFLGGDPIAEATAQLKGLMTGDADLYPGRTATDSAHIAVICERLRLLYVGITRARRYLHISRSRFTRSFGLNREAAPATALGVLHQYLKESTPGS